MNPPRKKVLIITYYFPPSGGAGVQRTLKFVKYLRQFSWEPVVLTARNADYPAYDESLFSEVPEGVHVYRSAILEPYRLYRKLTGRKADEATDIATLTLDKSEKSNFRERLAECIRSTFFIPDARIAWFFFAYHVGKKILQTENIDVIYSSAPPYTSHLIGLKLQRKAHLPWVADFRDSWIGWLSTPQWRPKFARRIEKSMEGAVLKHASKILTVSHGVKEDLLSRHPELQADRWHLLPNGFDAADFQNIQPIPDNERVIVTYVGSLYGPRNPEYLLRALEKIENESPGSLDNLCFRLVGRIGASIRNRIQSSSVRHLFEFISYVSHQKSLSYLLDSDVSLLIIDDAPANRGILTGKLFEYIGAGKPILALAPAGEAADLIRSKNLGWVVPPKDVQAIQHTVHKILAMKSPDNSQFHPDKNLQQQFDRRHQTGELANILDELIQWK